MSKLNTVGRINVLSTDPKSTIQDAADKCRYPNGMFVQAVPILTTGIPHLIAAKKWPETMLTSKQSAGRNLTRTDKVFNRFWPETWGHTRFQHSCLPE